MRLVRLHYPTGLILLGACALIWAVLSIPPFSAPRADAAIPAPQPGHAVVAVYIGGDRASDATVDPVRGAQFGLFTDEPTSFNVNGVFNGTATPVVTCTSDGDGYCSFQVPISALPASGRLWLAPTGLPVGWYSDPAWQTAPLTVSANDPRRLTPHVFQTPPLVAGETYISGNTYAGVSFMGDPGSQTTPPRSPSATTGFPNFTRRIASGGFWPLSRTNPTLPDKCGLNVAIVVDLSSSVATHISAIKGAIGSFVDGLRGSPSQAALFTFGTRSPAYDAAHGVGPNSSLMSVATTADANQFKALYANWTDPPATNYTNWDAGLQAASDANQAAEGEHFDLAVVLTDGNPTVYGADRTSTNIPTNSGYTRFREMEAAVDSSDTLKSDGTRILAMGVGDGLDAGAGANLRSISGQTAFDSQTNNILSADYFQEASYAQAGEALHDLVLESCAPSISVVKRIVPFGDTTTANAYAPADPWTFAASTTDPTTTITPTSGQTAPVTGGINFDIGGLHAENSPGSFTVNETPQADYTLFPTDNNGNQGANNAVCVNKSDPDNPDAPIPITNTANGFTVDVGFQDAVACVIYNQAPNFNEAHVVVHKRWQVTDSTTGTTTTYANGEQPPDFEAFLHLSGPGADPLQPWPWNVERHGYDAAADTDLTVSEHVYNNLPGCHLTGQPVITGTGIADPGDPMTLSDGPGEATTATHAPAISPGANAWTITNHITCASHLTLRKQVDGGPAQPTDWTLNATSNGLHHSGRHGDGSITDVPVPDERPFVLAEQADDDPELLNYVQDRVGPIHEGASGSWECEVGGSGADWIGFDGVVTVPLGLDATCTAINRTSTISIVKQVAGGDATASDWTFHLTPVDPDVEGLPDRTVAGSADGEQTFVRPGTTYRVHETGAPASYQLVSFECTVNGETVPGLDLHLMAGEHADCHAVNNFAEWTVTKTSDPPSGSSVQPGSLITYTLHAQQISGHPVQDVLITDDLSDVLPHATFLDDSIDASAGHAVRHGSTLTWTIPTLHGTQTLTYQMRVHDDAVGGSSLRNVLVDHTTTEPGDPGDEAAPCDQAPGAPGGTGPGDVPVCDEAVLDVVAATPSPTLPDTGGPSSWWLWGGLLMICVGGTFAAAARIRPKRG